MSLITSKTFGINLTEFHTGCKIFNKNFFNSVPIENTSDNYLFSFEIILQAAYFKKKYGEISISSSYKGYHTSCNYLNGFIYLLGNFKLMFLYFLSKVKLFKSKTFNQWKKLLLQVDLEGLVELYKDINQSLKYIIQQNQYST